MFFGLARRNLARHKARTLLAVIGIIIGVVAIASLGIFGNSIRLSVSDSFGEVGNELLIFPAFENGKTSISDETARLVTKVRGIDRVVPIRSNQDAVILNKDPSYATIYGMNGEDMPFLVEIDDGHFLRRNSDNCVVGHTLARDKELVIGSKVTIKDQSFRVVGILSEKGIGIAINPDQAIFVSSEMFSNLYGDSDYDNLIVKVKNLEEVERVREDIEKTVNKREDIIMVLAMEALLEGINSFFNTLSTFLMGIGS
ncbi:MAG: ABC transporter permease, partial [Halobacteriota archaeon]|nr:ABC transporter permease [Halobacteriota archaeon]